jgi:hypothetical protein
MMRVVTHHEGLEAGLDAAASSGIWPGADRTVESIVPGSARLDAREQLQIYAFMYFARLIEVMEAEYPTVLFLVGPDRFAQLARLFLRDQPSKHYNLARLSVGFPAFLASLADDQLYSGFAHALALVERAMEDVADDPEEPAVPYEVLASIPGERWAETRLQPIAAMRILCISHPINEFMNGVQGEWFAPIPEPAETHVLVYRSSFRFHREELSLEQFQLLTSLQSGATLGESIEAAAAIPEANIQTMMNELGSWFEQWMKQALFTKIQGG